MHLIDHTSHNWLAYKICNQALRRHLHLITGQVIDLGCGTAPFKDDILSSADNYIGVDWPNTLHGRKNVDVECDLCSPLPFPTDFADTVISTEVLEHLPSPGAFLSEAARILKPGGTLFVTVPFQWRVHEAPYDFYRYTRYGLQHLLQEAGFEQINITENTGFWQTWFLKFNYHTTRYARSFLRLLWIPVWWTTQIIAPLLDRISPEAEETAIYTVTATKP